jgi:tetratricopeptide (TPR) repeat protein
MSRKLYGDEGIDTAHVHAALAEAELQLGHLEAAERDAAAALAIREKALGLEHTDTAEARVLHGRVLLAQRRYAVAETALRPAFEQLQKQPGPRRGSGRPARPSSSSTRSGRSPRKRRAIAEATHAPAAHPAEGGVLPGVSGSGSQPAGLLGLGPYELSGLDCGSLIGWEEALATTI